jgi:hypothetical protein
MSAPAAVPVALSIATSDCQSDPSTADRDPSFGETISRRMNPPEPGNLRKKFWQKMRCPGAPDTRPPRKPRKGNP